MCPRMCPQAVLRHTRRGLHSQLSESSQVSSLKIFKRLCTHTIKLLTQKVPWLVLNLWTCVFIVQDLESICRWCCHSSIGDRNTTKTNRRTAAAGMPSATLLLGNWSGLALYHVANCPSQMPWSEQGLCPSPQLCWSQHQTPENRAVQTSGVKENEGNLGTMTSLWCHSLRFRLQDRCRDMWGITLNFSPETAEQFKELEGQQFLIQGEHIWWLASIIGGTGWWDGAMCWTGHETRLRMAWTRRLSL